MFPLVMFNPKRDALPTHHHNTSSPLKPLFTVTQGDRCHGNIPLQLIPVPITRETSRSQTKKHQENGQIGMRQSATAAPQDIHKLEGSQRFEIKLFIPRVQMMSGVKSGIKIRALFTIRSNVSLSFVCNPTLSSQFAP